MVPDGMMPSIVPPHSATSDPAFTPPRGLGARGRGPLSEAEPASRWRPPTSRASDSRDVASCLLNSSSRFVASFHLDSLLATCHSTQAPSMQPSSLRCRGATQKAPGNPRLPRRTQIVCSSAHQSDGAITRTLVGFAAGVSGRQQQDDDDDAGMRGIGVDFPSGQSVRLAFSFCGCIGCSPYPHPLGTAGQGGRAPPLRAGGPPLSAAGHDDTLTRHARGLNCSPRCVFRRRLCSPVTRSCRVQRLKRFP